MSESGFSHLLGEELTAQVVALGANNRVWFLRTASGRELVGKAYGEPETQRDRLDAEYGACSFLCEQGVKNVPVPVACDVNARLAAYTRLPGGPAGKELDRKDAQACAEFLLQVAALSKKPGAQTLALASEACFCGADIEAAVEGRYNALLRAPDQGESLTAMRDFLAKHWFPKWKVALDGARKECGSGWSVPLEPEKRILSPSDFGLHNARRGANGLGFLDFEYFGWDDAAKTVCDFLLHPAMHGEPGAYSVFCKCLFAGDSRFDVERVRLMLPLHGLKWCLLLLNEFTRKGAARRLFAGQGESRQILREQLEKSRHMLFCLDQGDFGEILSQCV